MSVVCASDLSAAVVALEFVGVEAQTAFEQIAAAANVQVGYVDGVVTFSKTEPQPSLAVYDLGYTGPDLAAAVSQLGEAKTRVVGDRLVVVGQPRELSAIADGMAVLDQGPDGWLLSVYVVQASDDLSTELGVSLGLGAKLDVSAVLTRGAAVFSGPRAEFLLSAVGRASQSGSSTKLVTEGSLFVLEGYDANMSQGEVIPVARRTVSDQGTVTINGYEQVRTGFQFKASARRVPGGVLLQLEPTLSQVTRFIGEVPATSERSVRGTVVVSDGDWIVLSGLDAAAWLNSTQGTPGLPAAVSLTNDQTTSARLLILVRARRAFSSAALAAGAAAVNEPRPAPIPVP